MRKHRLAGVVIAALIGVGTFAHRPTTHHAPTGTTRAGIQLLAAELPADHVITTAVPTVSGTPTVVPTGGTASTELRGALLHQLAGEVVTALVTPLGPQALAWDVRMEQLARQAEVNAYLGAVAANKAKAYLDAVAVAAKRQAAVPVRTAPAAPAEAVGPGLLVSLRDCESGGNYGADTGNGYYGAYQFTLGTWRSLGLGGLPDQAPPAVQDQAAQTLAARRGWGQWPSCARRLGL
jgi:hypothetical protein